MPFESFEKPPISSEEGIEEEVEEEGEKYLELKEFKKEEIEEAIERIAVVGDLENLSPDTLAKVNVENIDTILDLGTEKITKERQEINKDTFKNLEEGMEELSNRSSSAHALLCAVNGKEDFKAFRETVEKFTKEKKTEETDEKILYLKKTAERQIKMEEISGELLKIELKRRIGDLKKDDSFFLRSALQLENSTPKINEILDYFKKEEIQSKSEKIKDVTEKIEENLNLIKNKKADLIKDKFYDFCLDVSKLRFLDFEDLNEEKMKETVKSLVESYGK